MTPDEAAIERYLYMLRTAPPETIEQAHEEAFAKLTPEQRRQALQRLAEAVPPEERQLLRDDPRSLARAATRTEIREPGVLHRIFGGGAGASGFGGMFAGSLLASLAGSFIGTAIAGSFFHDHAGDWSAEQPVESAADLDDSGLGDDFGGSDFGDLTDI